MLKDIDLTLFNQSVPRYTSYPTALQFSALAPSLIDEKIKALTNKPLSLYVHIPFCKTMCLFCACNVILNRKPEVQKAYVENLLREIALWQNILGHRSIAQLHFGGGTPTSLDCEELQQIMGQFSKNWSFLPHAEIAIEIDPRSVDKTKMECIKYLKFNRISFGVQDLDLEVQEAVKRRQTEEMTVRTFELARSLHFGSINIDLIYGLPKQSPETFAKTVERLLSLSPDRMALYSYAKVPWIKKHQAAIPDELLPSTSDKLAIYVQARERFLQGGYMAIGMDHFAKEEDELAIAYKNKTLSRNFMGYSVPLAEDMIGFGVSSIGFFENMYVQNVKDLKDYAARLGQNELPISRGYVLTDEDKVRRAAILSWMCQFEIDKERFGALTDVSILVKQGLIEEKETKYIATDLGKIFIRIIASYYDAYLSPENRPFSKAI